MTEKSSGTDVPAGAGEGKAEGEGTGAIKALLYHDSQLVQGLYVIVLLIVLIATLQLYLAIQEVINRWFSYEYIPLISSLYFILVIAAGVYLIWLRITRR
jgi:hypothetical protein